MSKVAPPPPVPAPAPSPGLPGDLLSAVEAADLLQVSRKMINRWAAAGSLPTAAKAPGVRGARLFRRADVLARGRAYAAAAAPAAAEAS